MAFVYQQLTQDEMDTTIAENLKGHEAEVFRHELNAATSAALLARISEVGGKISDTDATWHARTQQLHDDALVESRRTQAVHAALSAQLSNPTRKAAAMARVTKRAQIQQALQFQAPAATAIDMSVLN